MNHSKVEKNSLIYQISSTKLLKLSFSELLLRASLLTENNEESQISLILPFDINELSKKMPSDEILSLFSQNFYPIQHKDSYLLSPILRGGGGVVCSSKSSKSKNQKNRFIQNEFKTVVQVSRESIEEKRNDIRSHYFFEQDQYPKSDSEVKLGRFYEELINVTFDELEKTQKEKFDLSIKNFRKFIKQKFKFQEQKLLETKLKEKFSENLESVLCFLLKIMREDLYIKDPKEPISQELIQAYERNILERLIDNSIFFHFKACTSEENLTFYEPLMSQIIKISKFLLRTQKNVTLSKSKFASLLESPLKKPNTKKQKPRKEEGSSFKTFHEFIEENYKKWLDLSCAKAYEEIQLFILRKICLNHYTTLLLIKYYNLSQKSEEPIDKLNRKLLENISFKILENYQEREDTLTSAELMELVTLAGIKQENADSSEKTINQRLLGLLCNDINNDVIFDSFKVQCLAVIIFQNTPTELKSSGRLDDDLKQCLDVIHKQVENRLFTSENQNMQDAMDALNIVLQIMAARSVKGLRNAKEKTALLNTFKDQIPSLNKQIFQTVTGSVSDPSLKIKAKYAQEAIKKIGDEDNALSDTENAILAIAPAVYSIAKGVFTMDTSAIEQGLLTIASTAIDIYVNLEKDWFEEVNKVLYLSNTEFERFEQRYFTVEGSNQGAKSEEIAFYIAKQLYSIAKTCERNYSERRKAVEFMGDVYEGKNIKGQKLSHFFFSVSTLKKEIKLYVHKCLSDLSKMPKEDQYPFEIPLCDVALKVLKRLNLIAMELDLKFEFNPSKSKLGNSLFLLTLKQKMIIDYSLGVLQSNSDEAYKKEIKEIDYIEIEGIQYLDKTKSNKRIPLWSKVSENAFDEFLNRSEYSVMLIQGDAGTGKSVFLKMIEYQQWKRYKLGINEYIPIYIRLAEINNVTKCITETLQTMHSSTELIESLKEEKNIRKYLFIFDGYDELKAPKNLYECNKILEYGKNAKVIVTSREEYLKAYGEYSKYFKANNNSILLEYRITPLSENQIKQYIQRRVDRDRKKINSLSFNNKLKKLFSEWDLEKYWKTIKEIQGLEELLKTPYMLKIIIDILPSLGSEFKTRITKSNIYKVFTMKHFETEMNRLLQHAQDQIPKGFDLEKSFYEYSKDLAVNMFMLDKTSVETEGFSYSIKKHDLNDLFSKKNPDGGEIKPENLKELDPFARFFLNDPVTKLARSGAQLIIFNGQARFTHKSIMEYFTARFYYDELKFNSIDLLPKGPMSLKLIYGGGQTNQESDVITFLKQMIDDNNEKQILLKGKNFEDKIKKESRIKDEPMKIIDPNDVEIEEENDQDTHVMNKIKELVKKRTTSQYPNMFYKNLLILYWFCEDTPLIEILNFSEITNLESQIDLPKKMRAEIARRLASNFHFGKGTNKDPDQCSTFSKKYIELHLSGVYKGRMDLDSKEGLWLPNGDGEMQYENGSYYKGKWVSAIQNGFGVMTFDKNNIYARYEGLFEDSFHGIGSLEYSNKSVYYGEWDSGEPINFGKKSYYKSNPKKKNRMELYEIYEGNWLKGAKNGDGVLHFNWEFPKLSFYQKYIGIWENDVIQSGVMVFRDGKKIEGIYSQETGLFFSNTSLSSFHFIGIKPHENLYKLQVVGMSDIKIPPIDELMKVDSFGNSLLVILLQKSNTNLFNNLASNLIEVLYKQKQYPLLPNDKGDNFVHMIVSNNNIDIETKIKLLIDLKTNKSFDTIFNDVIASYNKAQILPAMLALKLMTKDKETDFKIKSDFLFCLTPRRKISEYYQREESEAKKIYGQKPLDKIIDSKTISMILDENYVGKYCVIKNLLRIKEFWNEKLFKVILLSNDSEFISKFDFATYFYNFNGTSFNLFHMNEIILFLMRLIEKNISLNQPSSEKNEKNEKDLLGFTAPEYFEKRLKDFFKAIFVEKNSSKNPYLKAFFKNDDGSSKNSDFIDDIISTYTLGYNDEEKKKVFISLVSLFYEKFSHIKGDAKIEKFYTEVIKIIIDYYGDQNDFFLELLKNHYFLDRRTEKDRNSNINNYKMTLMRFISSTLKLKLDIHLNSEKETNYFSFFYNVLTKFRQVLMDSVDNLINLLRQCLRDALKKKEMTQEGIFYLMKIFEFSMKRSTFSDQDIEKLLIFFLETFNFIPREIMIEKMISNLILSNKDKLALSLLKKFEGKYIRIQNWHLEFFQYYKFFASPEDASKEFKSSEPEIKQRDYTRIKNNQLEKLENLELNIPNKERGNLNNKFLRGVKYFYLNHDPKIMGFFISTKEKIEELLPNNENVNYLKGCFKFNEKKMCFIEDNNLMKCLTSKKMSEVLKFIIKRNIFVKGLNETILTLDRNLVLDLYFESKLLFIDKQECLKNFSGQGRYYNIPNYYNIFNDFLLDKIKQSCFESNGLENLFKEPKILEIIKEFIVPSLKEDGFLKIFLHRMVNKLLEMHLNKGTDKILNFFLDFSKKMIDFIPKNEISDFICEFFFILELKFQKAVFFREPVLFSEKILVLDGSEAEIKKKEIELDDFSKKSSEFQKFQDDYFSKARELEKKKLEIAYLIQKSQFRDQFQTQKKNILKQYSGLSLQEIDQSHYFVDNKLLFKMIIEIIYKPEVAPFVTIIDEKLILYEKEDKKEPYNIKDFFTTLKDYQLNESEVILVKVQQIFQSLMNRRNISLRTSFAKTFIDFIVTWLRFQEEYKFLRQKIDPLLLEYAKFEEDFKKTREDFILAQKAHNENFSISTQISSQINYLQSIDNQYSTIVGSSFSIPNKKISKNEATQCFSTLIDFFFSNVWVNFKKVENKKFMKCLFEFFDHFLSKNFFESTACKILGANLIKKQVKLEEISPFGGWIYERLLLNCIKNNLVELTLDILKNFSGVIKEVKSWSIGGNEKNKRRINEEGDESEEEEGEEEKVIENKAKENEIKNEEKDIELIKVPCKIFIQNEKIIQMLYELKINYDELKELTMRKWCFRQPLERVKNFFILELDEIRKNNIKCNLENNLWLLLKKFNSKQKSIDFLMKDQEGHDFFEILLRQNLVNEKNINSAFSFILGDEKDPTQSIQDILGFLKDESFKIRFLEYCIKNFMKNTMIFKKIVKIFTDNLVKNDKIGNISFEWLMFFLKSPELISTFDEAFKKLLKIPKEYSEKLAKEKKDVTMMETLSCYNWFLMKNFMILYLKKFMSEKQILDSLTTFYGENKNPLFFVQIPNLDFGETMIYNLFKTIISWSSEKEDQKIQEELVNGKPFFNAILSFLGYEINATAESIYKLKKISCSKIMMPSDLLILKKELTDFASFSNELIQKVATYKKQFKFLEGSGMILPEKMELFGAFIFIIDFAMIVLMIEDLESTHFDVLLPNEFEYAIKFELSNSNNIKPIENQENKKIIVVQYKWEQSEKNKNLYIFKTNTDNVWDSKNLIKIENSWLNTFDNSMEIMEKMYFEDDLSDETVKNLMCKMTPISKLYIESKETTLIEMIVYNSLINFLICVENEKTQKNFRERIEKFLASYKGNCPFLFDLLLQTFGFSKEENKGNMLTLKKQEISLGSHRSLKHFKNKLDELLDKIIGRRKKIGPREIKFSKDYKYFKEIMNMEFPNKMIELSFCANLIDLTINLISLFSEIQIFIEKNEKLKGESILIKFQIWKEESLPKTSFSNSNGFNELTIYYRFEKKGRYVLLFGQNDIKGLKEKIVLSQEAKASSIGNIIKT